MTTELKHAIARLHGQPAATVAAEVPRILELLAAEIELNARRIGSYMTSPPQKPRPRRKKA